MYKAGKWRQRSINQARKTIVSDGILLKHFRFTIANVWHMFSPNENVNFLLECLSKLGEDFDSLLFLTSFGRVFSEDDLKTLLVHETIREQNGEHQLRLVGLWIDGD